MERIKELYHKKKVLERWLIASSFIPLPGITLGFLIQVMKIDKDIEKEINTLGDNTNTKYFILKENGNSGEKGK